MSSLLFSYTVDTFPPEYLDVHFHIFTYIISLRTFLRNTRGSRRFSLGVVLVAASVCGMLTDQPALELGERYLYYSYLEMGTLKLANIASIINANHCFGKLFQHDLV